MYVDPKTHITHMVWIENPSTEFQLVYSRKEPGKAPTKPIVLEGRVRPRLSNIIGEGDGKHIMISYDAKRVQGDDNDCTATDQRGCYEIYFSESFDNGDTWSKGVMIQHNDPKDKDDRKGPKMIYIKETKQTFITYWRSGSMVFSYRDGTGAFTKEIVMPFGTGTAYESLVYTVNPSTKKITLHFTYTNWRYPIEWLMYSSSTDFGRTWKTPREIAVNNHESSYDSYIRSFTVSNSDIMPGGIYIAFIRSNQVVMMWSKNEGLTWSRITSTHAGDAIAPRIQICKQPGNKLPQVYLLFGLRRPQNNHSFVFGKLDTSNDMYKDSEFPFKGMVMNWDYVVDCYVDGDKAVAAAIVESFKDDVNSIFISYNDDP